MCRQLCLKRGHLRYTDSYEVLSPTLDLLKQNLQEELWESPPPFLFLISTLIDLYRKASLGNIDGSVKKKDNLKLKSKS